MTMTARILLDEWKEEKYLRHYTIAHVLRTINWRWFEREGENQANHKIPLVTTCKKKKERERDLWFRMFRLCHRMYSRAPRCIEFVRRHSLTSPAIWLTLSLSSLLFLFILSSFHLTWHKAWILRKILRRRKMHARFHMMQSIEKRAKVEKLIENKQI